MDSGGVPLTSKASAVLTWLGERMTSETSVGLLAPLRVREFRYLWGAELWSVAGDQLARVALAVLVYARTSSASLTALTYALTFVPAILGGLTLSGLADRFPRRRVLVVTDVVRALLAAAMAVPAMPLPVLWALVAALSMVAAPFKAAQLALIPQVLTDERAYRAGLSLRMVTTQTAQVVGFAAGGVIMTAVEPHIALLLNAATFVVSAVLVLAGVRDRPASARRRTTAAAVATAPGPVWPIFVLSAVIGLYVVPEGIAAPYADELGLTTVGVGVLMAADPLGSVLGGWLAPRMRGEATIRVASLLGIAAGVPLVVCVVMPGLVVSAVLWAVSGALATLLLVRTQELVVKRVPDERRGGVMGRLSTTLQSSQGLAILAGGVAAEAFGSYRAIALAGLLAVAVAVFVGMTAVAPDHW
jgi:MFS family permease